MKLSFPPHIKIQWPIVLMFQSRCHFIGHKRVLLHNTCPYLHTVHFAHCNWFTNPHSSNKSAITLLYIPLPIRPSMFRPNCRCLTANSYIAKPYSTQRTSDVQMTVHSPLSIITQQQFVELNTNRHGDYWKQRRLSHFGTICNQQHVISVSL